MQAPVIVNNNNNNIPIAGPPNRAGATLRIAYAPGHGGQLIRPLIVAEGFDAGSVLTPEDEGGDRTLADFLLDIADIENPFAYDLYDKLVGEYDLVYVDWENGTQMIQTNSRVLENVLNWVNAKKAQAGSTAKNILWGQSMGGLVGRYTLAKMEKEGKTHDVGLFIAHDSPMQGSNTPVSVQHFTRHIHQEYVSSPALYFDYENVVPVIMDFYNWLTHGDDLEWMDINGPLTLQDSPAAVQMNKYYVDGNADVTTAYHDYWQKEFDDMGYPAQCRNIAISNGNECAVNHGYPANAKMVGLHTGDSPDFLQRLISLLGAPYFLGGMGEYHLIGLAHLPGSSRFLADFDLYANPEPFAQGRHVYNGKIRYEKKVLWLFSSTHTLMERTKTLDPGYLPLETYSGGSFDINSQGVEDITGYFPEGTVIQQYFGFIPVVSALDVKRNGQDVTPADYRKKYAGGVMPEVALATEFDNWIVDYSAGGNRPHISIQPRIGNWLLAEFNALPQQAYNCKFICEEAKIEGPDVVCTSGSFSIDGRFIRGEWSILPANAGTLVSGQNSNNVTFNFNSPYSGYVTIRVITTSNCGSVVFEKQVWRGKPGYPTGLWANNVYVSSFANFTTEAPGATSYQWTMPWPFLTVTQFNIYNPYWQVKTGANTGSTIQVFTGTGGVPGTVTVRGCNICGCSDTRSTNIVFSGPPRNVITHPDEMTYTVYPNPSSDYVYLTLRDQNNKPAPGALIKAELFDFYGASHGMVSIVNDTATIDVTNLPTGVYSLYVVVDNVSESHLIAVH